MQSIKEKLKQSFMQAPMVETSGLNNLFFELTNQNQLNKSIYGTLQKTTFNKEKDFLAVEKIKQTLLKTRRENLKSIYLMGGEPMLHPDFNTILRMCLKISNTTVLTNGTYINDKKARFLKKIDDESEYETIYRIRFEHYNEEKNDKIRGRGNFRKALLAIQNLYKYDFNPIITVSDYYKEKRETIFEGFRELCRKFDFEIGQINLKIIPYFSDNKNEFNQLENRDFDPCKLDCKNSKMVSSKGVFSCPALCNDFRARMGYTIENCSDKIYLDTEKCYICTKHPTKAYANDWM